jgi:hypothetical protein
MIVAMLTTSLAVASPVASATANNRPNECPFRAPLLGKVFEGVKVADFSESGPVNNQFEVCGFHVADTTSSYEITLALKVPHTDGPAISKSDSSSISVVHDPGLRVRYVQEQNKLGRVIRFLWAYNWADASVVTVQEWSDRSSRFIPKFDMKNALVIANTLLAVKHPKYGVPEK